MKIIVSDNFVQNPLVSVVIPSYNRANTVSQTIESILNQQCNFDFEIIVGDDCSTDNAREVLLAFQTQNPTKIKLLFYDKNIGIGASWATCVKQCRGKYIANCDNDDYWHNLKKIQLQVDFLEKHLQFGLCHTDYRKHNRTTNKITEHTCENILKEGDTLLQSLIRHHFVFCNASMLYRTSTLLQHVNMDDYIKHQFLLQDWNTWLLLAPFSEFACLHISTTTLGIETYSITRPKNINALEERWKKQKECYEYVREQLPEYYDYPYIEKEYDDYVNTACMDFSYETLDFRNAKKYASLLNSKSLRVRCAKNRLLFYPYAIISNLRRIYDSHSSFSPS